MIDIDFSKVKIKGKSIEQILKDEAGRFLSILQEEINRWYSSYTPAMYDRTYSMRDSIYVNDYVSVDIDKNRYTVKIMFDDSAFHKSLWSNEQVNSILLMNDGYQVKSDVWFADIKYFGYREAGHFLERAVDRFNKSNPFSIDIRIERSG